VRRLTKPTAILSLVIALALIPAAGAGAASKVSFTDIQNNLMCVACHEPLAVAQSQEAFSERAYVRELIAQGLTKKQILNQMVSQYGEEVLSKPPAKGFNLLIYVLPPVLLATGILTLVLTLPKWRQRARQAAATPLESKPPLDPEDAKRLDEDLSRHLEGA
jgi:cytochrome c-type biogenesis protein CcmH